MQPYAGTIQEEYADRVAVEVGSRSERLRDLLNVLLILNAWIILLLLVPPQHEYPVMDDWIYAGAVRDTLTTGVYTMPDWSQANLVGLVAWGILWVRLFGFSFSVLTFSVQFLAVVGLIAFYGVLRELNVRPWGALLGVLLLGFNPLYLHLSYSFMTDVPFLAVELAACYCMIKGVKVESTRAAIVWLVAGSLIAGWAFLIRQFGALVPVAFVAYLLISGLVTKRWAWDRILAILLASGLVFGGWYLWAHNVPTTSLAAQANGRAAAFILQPVWPRVIIVRLLTFLPFVALFTVTAVRMKLRSWLFVPLVFALFIASMYLVVQEPEVGAAQFEPPFTVQVGPVSFQLPQDEYTFGLQGSVVRPTGFDFDEFGYTQQEIWSPEVWRLLWVVSVGLAAVLVVYAVDRLGKAWRAWRSRLLVAPALAFYMVGASTMLISSAIQGDIFLRYSLAFMPFVILLMVRYSNEWGRVGWSFAGASLAVLVAFSVLAQADNMDHESARWQAGLWMEARVGAVRVGWNWDHWGHSDSEGYLVTDVPQEGYRVERTFPYTSRLSGFTTRQVLAESRFDMPPLPPPKSAP